MLTRWLLAFFLLPGLAQAADDFTSWQIPWEKTRPRDPAVDANGTVWFVGQGGDYVGRLDPEKNEITRFELPDGAGPHNVIVGDDGYLWIAGNRQGWLGRMNPENGELEQFATTDKGVRDPHTLIEADDGIWFTAQQSDVIGFFDTEEKKSRVWKTSARARPYGIVVDSDDKPWAVLLGTNKLATVEDDELAEIELPREDARPRRLDIIDGKIWYVDYAGGYVGTYDPEERTFSEWLSPSGERAAPYGAIADDDGRFWYVETGPQPNRMIGVDAESGEVIYNETIPQSGGAVRHMFFDEKRDAIWFGMDTNYITRFDLPEDRER